MIDKQALYEQSMEELGAVLEDVDDRVAIMATISCILKTNLPYYFWSGFYVKQGEGLIVGPYQGSLGCIHIAMGRGVCGTAAAQRKTLVVPDVHDFPGHIACDARSQSEIVVPVVDKTGALIAVFDVDASEKNCFDEVDAHHLERIMVRFFAE